VTEQLLLMNPRPRRRRRLANPRRRARRMPAGLRRYWASRRSHQSNPRRRPRRHRVRAYTERRRGQRVHVRSHISNPRRYHRRRLSNPRFSTRNLTEGYLIPAAVGALGGIGLDVAWGYASPHLPAALTSGWGAFAGQGGLAIGIGWGLSKVLPRHRREIATGVVGALVIITYNAIKPLIQQYVPSAGLRDYTSYRVGVGAYQPGSGVNRVIAQVPRRLGYMSPAASVGSGAVNMSGLAAYMPDGM
jgi:hypothetical protein